MVLFIHDSNSLKEKRMILHSLKARLRNRFNISVLQTADEDKWQKASIAVVGAAINSRMMHRILSQVVNFVQDVNQFELIDYKMELI
jgi:hypothetical protein